MHDTVQQEMTVNFSQMSIYVIGLLVLSYAAGLFTNYLRLCMPPFLIDVTLCFLVIWLGTSLWADSYGSLESLNSKLQLLIDLLIHIVKLLYDIHKILNHQLQNKTMKRSTSKESLNDNFKGDKTTIATGWLRDFKSESFTEMLKDKYC